MAETFKLEYTQVGPADCPGVSIQSQSRCHGWFLKERAGIPAQTICDMKNCPLLGAVALEGAADD